MNRDVLHAPESDSWSIDDGLTRIEVRQEKYISCEAGQYCMAGARAVVDIYKCEEHYSHIEIRLDDRQEVIYEIRHVTEYVDKYTFADGTEEWICTKGIQTGRPMPTREAE